MNLKTAIFPVLLALALAPAARAGQKHAAEGPALKTMTVNEVSAKIKNGEKIFVYDNNRPEMFSEKHVPGAVWLSPMEMKAADLPADKDATLVFYCANEKCMACHKGATTAMKLGYTNVFIMPQGIMGWEKAGMPVEAAKTGAQSDKKS